MTKLVSTLEVFHALSTVVAQYKGIARVVKTRLSDLELLRDCLAAEIDKSSQLQEQLKKEREAHKKEKDLAAANFNELRQERIMEKDKISMSGDTGNAWDKQVGGDHYKQYAIQPAQFALANGLDYAQSNAIKYIVRHKDKNGAQDLDKAIHYVELLKAHHYKGE